MDGEKPKLVRSSSRVKDLQRMFDKGKGNEKELDMSICYSRDGLPALVRDHAVKRDYKKPVYVNSTSPVHQKKVRTGGGHRNSSSAHNQNNDEQQRTAHYSSPPTGQPMERSDYHLTMSSPNTGPAIDTADYHTSVSSPARRPRTKNRDYQEARPDSMMSQQSHTSHVSRVSHVSTLSHGYPSKATSSKPTASNIFTEDYSDRKHLDESFEDNEWDGVNMNEAGSGYEQEWESPDEIRLPNTFKKAKIRQKNRAEEEEETVDNIENDDPKERSRYVVVRKGNRDGTTRKSKRDIADKKRDRHVDSETLETCENVLDQQIVKDKRKAIDAWNNREVIDVLDSWDDIGELKRDEEGEVEDEEEEEDAGTRRADECHQLTASTQTLQSSGSGQLSRKLSKKERSAAIESGRNYSRSNVERSSSFACIGNQSRPVKNKPTIQRNTSFKDIIACEVDQDLATMDYENTMLDYEIMQSVDPEEDRQDVTNKPEHFYDQHASAINSSQVMKPNGINDYTDLSDLEDNNQQKVDRVDNDDFSDESDSNTDEHEYLEQAGQSGHYNKIAASRKPERVEVKPMVVGKPPVGDSPMHKRSSQKFSRYDESKYSGDAASIEEFYNNEKRRISIEMAKHRSSGGWETSQRLSGLCSLTDGNEKRSAAAVQFQEDSDKVSTSVRSSFEESAFRISDEVVGQSLRPDIVFRPLELAGYVGFSRLPDQIYKKSIRTGFELNLMVIGEDGLGKQTLINSLFKTDISARDNTHNVQIIGALRRNELNLIENNVRLKLRIIDVPHFAGNIDNSECWLPVVEFLNANFEQYMRDESSVHRGTIMDTRPHVCLYFIPPIGHGLRSLDVEVLQAIHHKVNVIPLIAKADSFTGPELIEFKRQVSSDLEKFNIAVFSEPLAVIGGEKHTGDQEKEFLQRSYCWADIHIENPEFCDFAKLRTLLLHEKTMDLIENTHHQIYQKYREEQLLTINYTQVFSSDKRESRRLKALEKDMECILQDKVEKRRQKMEEYSQREEDKFHKELQKMQQQKEQLEESRRLLNRLKKDLALPENKSKSLANLGEVERRHLVASVSASGVPENGLARSHRRSGTGAAGAKSKSSSMVNWLREGSPRPSRNILGLMTLRRKKK